MASKRFCEIDTASVEDASGAGDGCYDLISPVVKGTPKQVAKKIAEALAEVDMYGGSRGGSLLEDQNVDLYITVRIKVRKASKPKWDVDEEDFDDEWMQAREDHKKETKLEQLMPPIADPEVGPTPNDVPNTLGRYATTPLRRRNPMEH